MILHHVGIVVDNLAEAIPLFKVWLGARPVGEIVEDEAQAARIQLFLLNNDTLLEVVEAIPGTDSPLHTVGEFHLCYTVPDIDAEMQRMHDMGMIVTRALGNAPLFNNQRIAFLATHSGQLLELLEDPSMAMQ
ncbi:MAG TPA: VOC family protein [Armatimonadota bacterium]|jgi:catechol 2,3-dioxygenase-like lactoylglutathione lyase family enzyme